MAMTDPIAKAVEAHALAHYEEGGWDVIYETYDEREILAELELARGPEEPPLDEEAALKHFAWVAEVQAERRAGQSFWG